MIQNELGLHARAATKLVQLASKYPCEVTRDQGRPRGQRQEHHGRADAGRVARARRITIRAKGERAAEAVAALAALVDDKFGEERVSASERRARATEIRRHGSRRLGGHRVRPRVPDRPRHAQGAAPSHRGRRRRHRGRAALQGDRGERQAAREDQGEARVGERERLPHHHRAPADAPRRAPGRRGRRLHPRRADQRRVGAAQRGRRHPRRVRRDRGRVLPRAAQRRRVRRSSACCATCSAATPGRCSRRPTRSSSPTTCRRPTPRSSTRRRSPA